MQEMRRTHEEHPSDPAICVVGADGPDSGKAGPRDGRALACALEIYLACALEIYLACALVR